MPTPRRKVKRANGTRECRWNTVEEVNLGANYSDAESEFLKAVCRWRSARGGKYPTCRDVLMIVHTLGYRKVTEPG